MGASLSWPFLHTVLVTVAASLMEEAVPAESKRVGRAWLISHEREREREREKKEKKIVR